MKRLTQLEFLVFKLGGVAGAIRRLIYRWKGVFTIEIVYHNTWELVYKLSPYQLQFKFA